MPATGWLSRVPPHGALEGGVAEAEDAAVGDEPVAVACRCGGDAGKRRRQAELDRVFGLPPVAADGAALSLPDDGVDASLVFAVLPVADDPIAVLLEARRLAPAWGPQRPPRCRCRSSAPSWEPIPELRRGGPLVRHAGLHLVPAPRPSASLPRPVGLTTRTTASTGPRTRSPLPSTTAASDQPPSSLGVVLVRRGEPLRRDRRRVLPEPVDAVAARAAEGRATAGGADPADAAARGRRLCWRRARQVRSRRPVGTGAAGACADRPATMRGTGACTTNRM